MWGILTILSFAGIAHSEKCRAISLEGGGSHGAYEAGAIWQLVNSLPSEEVAWNVVTGVSTGALNSGGVAQYAMGEEKAMANLLIDVWTSITQEKVYVNWKPGGIVQGLLSEYGLYDTTPLKETVNSLFNRGIHRNISVGATNMNTGEFVDFSEDLGSDILEGIICSASPPFFFPHQQFLGTTFADGGCVINLDVFKAVERCLDVVGQEKDIIVDMIFDSYPGTLSQSEDLTTLEVLYRIWKIQRYDSSLWYYNNAILAYPEVYFRFVVIPTKKMPGGIVPLNFDPQVLETEIEEGKQDVQNLLNSNSDARQTIAKLFKENQAKIAYA